MGLSVRQLQKAYATTVLDGVDLDIPAGEIHGLVGENGAGKSTLLNILSGLTPCDGGEMTIDDERYDPTAITDAFAAGIALCAQELSLIENLSVAENISLRALPGQWRVDRDALQNSALTVLRELDLDLSPDQRIADLSLSHRQLVEIAKVLTWQNSVLLLDEPTSALTENQADVLHRCLRARAATGTAVLYVSHRLEDVLALCDHIWVLRDGQVAHHGPAAELTSADLIRHMSGTQLLSQEPDHGTEAGAVHLRVDRLTSDALPHPLTFDCRQGEILGLAGLMGAGKTEILEAVYGLAAHTSGTVTVTHKDAEVSLGSVGTAVAAGVGLVPENRATHGVFHGLSVAFNTVIADLSRVAGRVMLNRQAQSQAVSALIEQLQVKCDSDSQSIVALSGGNQQKLMLARWLHHQCSLFLLDEPTRGVDVGSKLAIHELLRSLKGQGAAVVVASSELEELMALCDRIIVMSGRQIAAVVTRGNYDKDDFLTAAFSNYASGEVA